MKYFFYLILLVLYENSLHPQELLFPYKLDRDQLGATIVIKSEKGNIARGKKVFSNRKVNCLSCHQAPIPEEKFQGNFGPSLTGVGSRYSREEIRLRVINSKIINPESIMPSYFVKIDNSRTPYKLLGKTILTFKEVEDIVEYLYSLK